MANQSVGNIEQRQIHSAETSWGGQLAKDFVNAFRLMWLHGIDSWWGIDTGQWSELFVTELNDWSNTFDENAWTPTSIKLN